VPSLSLPSHAPTTPNTTPNTNPTTVGGGRGKQSRGEKKARKAVAKLGMKQVPGISRVSIKKSKHVVFVINNPDVFRAPGSDTVVIFGEAKVEDAGAQLAQLGLERLGMGAGAGAGAGPASAGGADAVVGGATVVEEEDADGAGAAAADEGGEPVDEAGVEAKDVDLVMTQASVSRAKAVAALKASGGDIVAAIMELTM